MMVNTVISAELEIVEYVIKSCYKKIDTNKLESYLYAILNKREFADVRNLGEQVLLSINDYFYAAEEPVVNLDFKRGMDELNFWSMRLAKKMALKNTPQSKLAYQLLFDLIDEINTCELRLNNNLSKLGVDKNLKN